MFKNVSSFLFYFSLFIFSFFNLNAQTVTVDNPNGGEILYACEQYTINWSTSGTLSNYYDIDYSLDGGTIWASVATNFLSTNGQFVWTVPSVQSTTCLIRVTDAQDNSTIDESDALFTINIPITVLVPNGGEVFSSQSAQIISWNGVGTSNVYDIYYSTNGGSNWTIVAANYSTIGNTFNWTVPNTPSTNCLVKIVDDVTQCMVDVSDAPFTITPLPATLTYPNGGENIDAGCAFNIQWDNETFYTSVRIDYSSDGGTIWNTIIASTSNDGYHSWTPPAGVFGTNYKIRVSEYNNASVNDESDATFTIRNPIEVTTPNGGETWYGCSTYTVTWNKPNSCISRFTPQYSTDNGVTWTNMTSYVSNQSGLTQSYNWTVPNGITTTEALVRVRDYYNSTTIFDVSDATFTILPSNDITVTYANGGETFLSFGSENLTWTNLPSASGAYNLQYSTNGGSNWILIVNNIVGNSYNWTVPNNPSTTCLIKVIDAGNTCKFDVSDAVFEITPQTPLVTYPNGGEVLDAGCAFNVQWDNNTYYTSVRIDYSTDGGTSWINIIASTSNDGYHSWTPPTGVYGTTYKVKVSTYNNLPVNDESDAVFEVKNPIEVTTPNGGETWYGCSTYTVTWNKPNSCISRFTPQYSTDNGVTWTNMTSYVSNQSGLTQSYNWTVPNGITSTEALVRVRDYYNASTTFDVSDANFTILPSNDVTVTAPNGGEVLPALSAYTLTWTNLASASGLYNLQYSTNGGASWILIVNGVTGNSYAWTVPNNPSTTCLIKVIDAGNTCKFDVSDAVFEITPQTPLVTYPNGGEVLDAGCAFNVQWDNNTYYTSVRIDYSTDGGTSWINIIASTSNDGYHSWTPPTGVYGTTYKVKVSTYNNLPVNDESDAVFEVKNPIEVTTPNGGETWYGCSTYTVTWNKPNSCISRFTPQYSTDNGVTWTSMTSYVSNQSGLTQSYNWTVPNGITSTEALVRVRDYYNASTTFDVSDVNFTILPSNDVTVTAPNGGENFQGLSSQTLTWTNLASASGLYNLQYSTNGGGNWVTIANGISGNAYVWTVPNNPSTTCLIKVIDAGNTCKFDVSDAVFTVYPAIPLVTSPNGGEVWYAATNKLITWDASTYYSSVRIDYTTDNGFTWNNIITATTNDGSHSWPIPNTPSNQCLVRVSNTADLSIYDESNNVFEIKAAVTILTPNGDDGITNWGGCTVTSITFDHTPAYDRWNIYYSLDAGVTWNSIAYNWYNNSNPTTYNWNIPNTSSSQVMVKVDPYYNTSFNDESDAAFTVDKPVTIIQPNFGGIMQVGSVYPIEWSSDGISNFYDIFFSDNGGSTWSTVVLGYNTSTNTYPWTVPNAPSANCLIRVRDNINTCKEDTSDIAFTISTSAPALTLLSPNGGDTLYGCDSYSINWAESSIAGNYDVAYSDNAGTTWNDIVLNYSTVSSNYSWVVPNINSQNVLVRVKVNSTAISDVSDALLTILNGNLVVETNDTLICLGSPVQLQASGANSYLWTPSTGLNNATISNPIATPAITTTYVVSSTNGTCILSDSVTIITSNSGAVPVSVTTSVNPSNVICDGNSVTFTAVPTNEGTMPNYQWLLNGNPVGINNTTFTSSTLSNNDIVEVVLTSNQACVTNNPATSSAVTMNVSTVSTPTVSIAASTATICSGENVTFTASPTNGGASPSYQWQVNGTNVGSNNVNFSSTTLSNLDDVTVILTSSSICAIGGPVTSNTVSMTVNDTPTTPSAISGSSSICEANNEVYAVSPVIGATSYTWTLPVSWAGISTSEIISTTSGNNGGTISVVANNACGSSLPSTISVVVNTNPIVTANANASAMTICSGESVILSGSGTNSYSWNNGVTDGIAFVPTMTATYQVTGTSTAGCTDTDQIIITVNNLPTITANTTAASICAGEAITLSASGGNIYNWDNGVTNNVAFVPNSTTYTVTGTDVNGCVNTDQVAIVVNTLPTVNAGLDQTVCENTMITLSGVGATTYSWDNGITDNTPFSATTTTYSVTGTDVNGCTNTDQVDVIVNTAPTVSASSSAIEICLGETVTLTGSGANSYAWDFGVMDNTVFTPSSTQTYTVTGTDASGCSSIAQVTVTVNALPTVVANSTTLAICPTENITLSGAGAASYSWDNGILNGTPFAPLSTTTYTVTGTDVNGCINTDQVAIVVNTLPTVNAGLDQTVCENTMITLSGVGATTYSWDNGITDNTPFSATTTTTYIVTGTDVNGCTNTDQVDVIVNTAPAVSASSSAIEICLGEPVTLTGSGANSYVWDFGVMDNTVFTPSSTQTYTVTGTDASGCSSTTPITVVVNALPTVVANSTALVICPTENITLSGAGAASYSWDNGILNGTPFAPLSTTTYTVTGTDVNGCINTDQVAIVVNTLPTVNAGLDQTVCENTMITLSGVGATTYSWDNGITDNTPFSAITTTTYSVTGTDGNGCTNTDQVDVIVNTAPAVTASASDLEICLGETVILNGAGATTYSWNFGITDGVAFSPSNTETYTVIGTDGNGCIGTNDISITINALPNIQTSMNVEICEGETTDISVNGGANYQWDNGLGVASINTVNPTVTTTYSVSGTDINGCVNTDDVTVTVNSSTTPIISILGNTLSTTIFTSYQWYLNGSPIGGATSVDYVFAVNGTYSVEVEDGNGCPGMSNDFIVSNVGIEDVQWNNIITYPNPTNGVLNIDFGKISGLKTIRIIDVSGRMVEVFTTTDEKSTFDLNIADGAYQVVIHSENGLMVYNEKIVVQH